MVFIQSGKWYDQKKQSQMRTQWITFKNLKIPRLDKMICDIKRFIFIFSTHCKACLSMI